MKGCHGHVAEKCPLLTLDSLAADYWLGGVATALYALCTERDFGFEVLQSSFMAM